MTDKTNPATPDKSSGARPKHSMRTRFSGIRSRVRRVHLVTAGMLIVLLAAGGAAWALLGGSSSPEAGNPDAANTGAAPGGSASTSPTPAAAPTGSASTDPAPTPSAPPSASVVGFPVPTWTEPSGGSRWNGGRSGGRGGGSQQAPGMPTELRADRDGDTVVLQWSDNTNNEDGFTIFVSQGSANFQIVVPAGTTRYEVAARQNTRTCFAVVPFSWSAPVASSPAARWECTGRQR